jgi:transglutaminase-like putative cysteine protease
MRYDIRLSIDYQYPAASDHVRNILRLVPAAVGPQQKLERHMLTITPPPDERRDMVDFFGNPVTQVAWNRPVRRLTFALQARAERFARPELDLSTPLAALADQIAEQGLAPDAPLHFRAPSARIGALPEIADFARDCLIAGTSTRAIVQALGLALHRHMTFDAKATDAGTPPELAFAQGRGVCQDFAQIMIAGLRSIGIPAAYISGFLRTTPPPGKPRLAGVDAMHAWVAAWCGKQAGWVEYDPTNEQWAGEDYIRVAWGRDYADAAPVRGAIRTSGAQSSGHKVDVIALGPSCG